MPSLTWTLRMSLMFLLGSLQMSRIKVNAATLHYNWLCFQLPSCFTFVDTNIMMIKTSCFKTCRLLQDGGGCCLWFCCCVFIFLASVSTLHLVCLFLVCHSYEVVNSAALKGWYIVIFWLVWRKLLKGAFVKCAVMVKFGFYTGFVMPPESTSVRYRSGENLVNLYLSLLVGSVYSVREKYFRTICIVKSTAALIPVKHLQIKLHCTHLQI